MALRARARRIAALALLGAWLLAPAAGADSGDGGQLVFTDGIDGRAIYERIRNRVSERIFRAPPPDDP
jgi:hypothetical protein